MTPLSAVEEALHSRDGHGDHIRVMPVRTVGFAVEARFKALRAAEKIRQQQAQTQAHAHAHSEAQNSMRSQDTTRKTPDSVRSQGSNTEPVMQRISRLRVEIRLVQRWTQRHRRRLLAVMAMLSVYQR